MKKTTKEVPALLDAVGQMYDRLNGGAGDSVRKHFAAAGIAGWEDLDRDGLYRLRDEIAGSVAPGTARTIAARIAAVLRRYEDRVDELPGDWQKVLRFKDDKPARCFLNAGELRLFEGLFVGDGSDAKKLRCVQVECLLEAYTGARVSDILTLSPANVSGDVLTYTSQKTHTRASVPAGPMVRKWLEELEQLRAVSPTVMSTRLRIIETLCRRAGIDTPVAVHKAGKNITGPKWQFVTTHTFRISFVTNLYLAGLDLLSISRMAGHSDVKMTERYCAVTQPVLPTAAAAYLGVSQNAGE